MRRRFGRGRRRGSAASEKSEAIDAAASLQRIADSGLTGTDALQPLELAGVPPEAAVVGEGEEGGVLVAWSPRSGGDALFALLALVWSRPGFAGRAFAIAPEWSAASRRRLALVGSQSFTLRALAAPQLALAPSEVAAASPDAPLPMAPERVARAIARPEERELFLRALAGLEGLAAKHGGVVRGIEDRVDLLLVARSMASLRAGRAGVRLELTGADRATLDLGREGLATALDRLEGSLRKHLNDRRTRSSEEGLRTSLLPIFERAAGIRNSCAWPLATAEAGPVDLVGVDGNGRLTIAAARERLDLTAAGDVVDAALDTRVRWPLAWGEGGLPAGNAGPRVLFAAREHDDVVLQVLALLSIDAEVYEIVSRRGDALRLERRDLPERAAVAPATSPSESAPGSESMPSMPRPDRAVVEPEVAERAASAASASAETEPATPDAAPRFEELSLFDLEEEAGSSGSGEGSPRRRRSRGGRRRGRRGQGAAEPASEGDSRDDAPPPPPPEAAARGEEDAPRGRRGRSRDRGRGRDRGGDRGSESVRERATEAPDAEEEELVDDDGLATLSDDLPEPVVAGDLRYEDEDAGEEGDAEADKVRVERELRRRARKTEPEEPPRPPRRRAAFVAHADRISVLTAVLLARDVRLVESFWVYPQEDLMTFFRSVATDLREETPIFLIGYTASPPARDTFQAASLYRGRLHWFDHHDWPPEDLVSLAEAIGDDAVHIEPGSESSMASVLAERTRRSRFSDKLVELATGRFSQHDYERWGRVWWHRVGDIAQRRGDRRADIEPLLAGRPSDLAKEAARVQAPPLPPELSYVSERDFRLVHFGGYVMVVLDVPGELDTHLTARIARERYQAQLSLASREGSDLLVLGGEESGTRRGMDLGGMTAHLGAKHEWITALRDDDHVARVRVQDLRSVPGRLDEVVSEIAMGRSIIEG